MEPRCRTLRRCSALPIGLAIAFLVCGSGILLAGDPTPDSPPSIFQDTMVRKTPLPETVETPVRAFSIGQADLTRRAGVQLESLAALERSLAPGRELADHPMFEQLQGSVRNSLERTTRDMLEDVLLDATLLDYQLDRLTGHFMNRGSSAGPALADGGRRSLDFDFSIRGIVPGLKMHYGLGQGDLKLRLDARGRVGLGYSGRRFGNAGIWAGFDGDDRFDISAHLGF